MPSTFTCPTFSHIYFKSASVLVLLVLLVQLVLLVLLVLLVRLVTEEGRQREVVRGRSSEGGRRREVVRGRQQRQGEEEKKEEGVSVKT